MPIETTPFQAEQYFTTPEAQARLLTEALESCDPAFIAATLGVVAKARGMSKVAADTGMSRSTLYSALSEDGNPGLDTVVRVLKAVGIKLEAKPIVLETA